MAQRDDVHVLVVDDQPDLVEVLVEGLKEAGYSAQGCSEPAEALRLVQRGEHQALVTDLRMPGHDGFQLLAASRAAAPESPVIIMTAFSAVDSAVEAIRRGAYHYLTKPFSTAELVLFLGRAQEEVALRRESRALRSSLSPGLTGLVGQSPAMRELHQLVRRVADAGVPVLLLGETGTGKGLVARALHAESARGGRAFVSVNCAALPDTLLESELFGHVKGAFTGAVSTRTGLFEAADGGTLFLDEIGEMSPSLQAKLLTTLETGRFRVLGEVRERAADVRLVAATHRDLRAAAVAGRFREDLLYRLDVVSIELPPLRHRRDDIALLANHFLAQQVAARPQTLPRRVSAEALEVLLAHAWPGNVRELQHVIERAALLGNTPFIERADLPRALTAPDAARRPVDFGAEVVTMRETQRRYAAWALERFQGHKRQTCEALDLDLKTLNRLLAPPDEPA